MELQIDTFYSYSPYFDAIREQSRGRRRSDKSIREEIAEMIHAHTSIMSDDIQINVENGDVLLEGTVPERSMKLLAEEVAEKCFGIRDVLNHIEQRA